MPHPSPHQKVQLESLLDAFLVAARQRDNASREQTTTADPLRHLLFAGVVAGLEIAQIIADLTPKEAQAVSAGIASFLLEP